MLKNAITTSKNLDLMRSSLQKLQINDHELKKLNLKICALNITGRYTEVTEFNQDKFLGDDSYAFVFINRYIDDEEAALMLAGLVFEKNGFEKISSKSGPLHFGLINSILSLCYTDVFERTEAYNQFYFINDMRVHEYPIMECVNRYLDYAN